jgi:hypothetical protein
LTCSFSSYEGSVTEKTTHLPSGLIDGEPTRFIPKSVSCVSGVRSARAAVARRSRRRVRFSMAEGL